MTPTPSIHHTTYTLAGGLLIALDKALGSGGEARVYSINGDANHVAKIYHQPTPTRIAKLNSMLANPPTDPTRYQGHVSIAWPSELIYDASRNCVGFLMPRIYYDTNAQMLEMYNPAGRRRKAPNFTWQYLLRTARNLASVVEAVHSAGYVIGDLNESNLFVSNKALVTLVDCDSMQVPGPGGKTFRCTVGKEEYTPPELQGVDLGAVDRAPEADNFGLAVLIFMLLMEGVHPYMGVWSGAGNPPDIKTNISTGNCPYIGAAGMQPPPIAIPFDILPPEVQTLAIRCFGAGHHDPKSRPSAGEWYQALSRAEGQLVVCKANNQHRYSQHLGSRCPWCERMSKLGLPDPFPPLGYQQPLPVTSFTQPLPVLQTPTTQVNLTPVAANPPRTANTGKAGSRLARWLAVGSVVAVAGWIGLSQANKLPIFSTGISTLPTPAGGITPTALVETPGPNIVPPETPRTGRIAFMSNRDGDEEIYVMDEDGSNQRRITSSPGGDQLPTWSPDGKQIAFMSNRDGNWDVYTMGADGSNVMRLTDNAADDRHPTWSPDGKQIAFNSNRDGNPDLFVMNADGNGQTPLTRNTNVDGGPDWSPNGQYLAFNSNRTGDYEIYTLDVITKDLVRLTDSTRADDGAAWSRDGRYVAFNSARTGNYEVFRMDNDGTNQVQLTFSDKSDDAPTWSPDGGRIAFNAKRDGNFDIYVMNFDGSRQVALTNNARDDQQPAWSP